MFQTSVLGVVCTGRKGYIIFYVQMMVFIRYYILAVLPYSKSIYIIEICLFCTKIENGDLTAKSEIMIIGLTTSCEII